MSQPLVSILLPAYNAAQYIAETIESIVAQTYTNWELLVIDDASNDATPAIVAGYRDPRIVIETNAVNCGLAISLNKALALAKGDYIARIDADDICMPDRLAEQVNYMEQHTNVVLCGVWAKPINADGHAMAGIMANATDNAVLKASLFFGCPFLHPSIMLRSSVLVSNHLNYSTEAKQAEDYILYASLLPLGDFASIPKPLIQYRVHESSSRITHDRNNADILAGRKIAWRKMLQRLELTASDEVLLVHDKITYYPLRISTTDVPHFIPYLQLLIAMHAANQQIKLFDGVLFRREIGHRLYSTLLHEKVSFGWAMGWYFRKCGFLSPIEKLKFPLAKAKRSWLGRG